MASSLVEQIQPAYDGLDTDSAPDYIAKTKAPVLDNFLVDRPGVLPMRGPVLDSIDLYTGALVGKPVGIWAHNNNLLIGLKANSATATRDPWVAPYRRASAGSQLGIHHTTIYHVNLETRVATPVTSATANTTPGPRHARVGVNTYGISFSGLADHTTNGGVQRLSAICKWGGTAVLPTPATSTTVAPFGCQDVKAHLNRLFALGGCIPGTTTPAPNSLFWSDLGGPALTVLTDWQDDVSGLVNQLVVDSDDPSDFGVALAKITAGLVIFKRRSIHVLRGATPASFQLQTFTTNVGCIDPRSVVEYEGGVFFMSDQGYQYFDGAQLITTTDDLRSSLLTEALAMVGDAGVDGGQVIAGQLPNGYIGLSVGQSPATTDSSDVRFSAVYHVPRSAWAGFTSDVMSAKRPLAFGRALSRSYLVDDQRLFAGDAITAPETVSEDRRGFDEAAALVTFDPVVGLTFTGTGDTAENPTTGVEAFLSATFDVIPSRWHSRLAKLAQPTHKAVPSRLLLDYKFIVDGEPDDGSLGWYVELVDGLGNVLVPEFQVPVQGDPSTYAYRRQHVQDVYAEANDAQLRVEWRGTQPIAAQEAAVLSAYLEYQPAQQRRSG